MTVAELIAKLREMPQDAIIAVPSEPGLSGICRADRIRLVEAKDPVEYFDAPELETWPFDHNPNPLFMAVVID